MFEVLGPLFGGRKFHLSTVGKHDIYWKLVTPCNPAQASADIDKMHQYCHCCTEACCNTNDQKLLEQDLLAKAFSLAERFCLVCFAGPLGKAQRLHRRGLHSTANIVVTRMFCFFVVFCLARPIQAVADSAQLDAPKKSTRTTWWKECKVSACFLFFLVLQDGTNSCIARLCFKDPAACWFYVFSMGSSMHAQDRPWRTVWWCIFWQWNFSSGQDWWVVLEIQVLHCSHVVSLHDTGSSTMSLGPSCLPRLWRGQWLKQQHACLWMATSVHSFIGGLAY